MLSIEEITSFIESDRTSDKKRFAHSGEDYYDGNHQIRGYQLFYVNNDGNLVPDMTRSNIKISHPFFTELVDQEVQYMLSGKDNHVKSDILELQKQLNNYFDDGFWSECYELLTDCVSKGMGYMYAYKAVNGKSKFQTADSLGVVEVRAKDTDDGCEYVIYWYVDRIEKGQKAIKRIQVFDKNKTWYYVQVEDGKVQLDASVGINPRPHIVYQKSSDDALYYEGNGGYGFIPFFRLDNNRKQVSGLKPVKDLIDDYDLMACGLSNNLQDISEGIYVVKGFQGNNLDELIQNTKVKKHIGVSPDGDLDIKTINIPYEARKVKLELDEKNIYRLGMGFNSAQLGDGNITNIVIKSRYALLDLKCNKLEIRLREFMRKLLIVILDEINQTCQTSYTMQDVYFDFQREVMTNAQDNAQIKLIDAQKQGQLVNNILSVASRLDEETTLKSICDVLDLDYDNVQNKVENAEQILNIVIPE